MIEENKSFNLKGKNQKGLSSPVPKKKVPFKRKAVNDENLLLMANKKKTVEVGSRLNLVKTASPKKEYKPLKYLAKNDLYDETWLEKQSRTFTIWLNYDLQRENTDELFGMEKYIYLMQIEKIRRRASLIYQSDSVRSVINKINAVFSYLT